MRPAQKPNVEAERHARTLRAVELRARGKSYRDIADETGVSVATAYEDVWRHFTELDTMATEKLEQVRKLELARLDRMLERLFGIMDRGNVVDAEGGFIDVDGTAVKAIIAASKLMERRAKLLGLDAPTKIQEVPASGYEEMTAAEKIAAHEAAIADERAKLEARH